MNLRRRTAAQPRTLATPPVSSAADPALTGMRPARLSTEGGPVIGIALGSGSARGWAHVGVLQALEEMGIRPAIVCGSSMGALVGAAYVSGRLDELAQWGQSLRRRGFFRFVDLRMPGGGLVQGGRLMDALSEFIADVPMESLPRPFAAVATDLASGSEVWLREGALHEAVRASIAVPGLLTPLRVGERWLVDGGLVNPVPVSLCRALGAQLVIGVNPFGDRLARMNQLASQGNGTANLPGEDEAPRKGLRGMRGRKRRTDAAVEGQERGNGKSPGVMDVLMGALNIMQDRITRSRMAGDPPDVLLAPRVAHISLLEFNRAEEAIAEGRACVQRMLPVLQDVMGL